MCLCLLPDRLSRHERHSYLHPSLICFDVMFVRAWLVVLSSVVAVVDLSALFQIEGHREEKKGNTSYEIELSDTDREEEEHRLQDKASYNPWGSFSRKILLLFP